MGIDLGDDDPTVSGPPAKGTEPEEIQADALVYEVIADVFGEMSAPMRLQLLSHIDRDPPTPFAELPEEVQEVFTAMAEELFPEDEETEEG